MAGSRQIYHHAKGEPAAFTGKSDGLCRKLLKKMAMGAVRKQIGPARERGDEERRAFIVMFVCCRQPFSRACAAYCAFASPSTKVKVLPSPTLVLTSISPCISSTTSLAIDRPRPVPLVRMRERSAL